MGWEEILDAEGADMAGAYENSLPEEDCGTTGHYVSGMHLDDDVVGSYLYDTMRDLDDTLRDWGFYDYNGCVCEPSLDDPYWELESKTSDELVEECIKFSQEAKHVKCVLKDAGQDIDTLFDYLDRRAWFDQNVSAGEREEDRRIIESKLKYEEESMCDDELREKCRAMTRDELMNKHIVIEGIKDAAVYILLFIEDVIKELRTGLYCEFEGEQDLKDLMEKYKEPLPETRELAEKIAEEEAAREKAEEEKAAREKAAKEKAAKEKVAKKVKEVQEKARGPQAEWDKLMAIYDAKREAYMIKKYGSLNPDNYEFGAVDELPMNMEELRGLLKMLDEELSRD